MKKLLLLATLAVAMMTTACSDYTYQTVEGDPMQTRIYTLENGLTVYLSVNDLAPRMQTAIAVRVGGKNDPAETTGLAHYFEHLMFKGTPHFGTSNYEAEKPLLDEIERLFEIYRTTSDEKEREALYKVIDSVSYEASKISIPNEYDKLMSAIGATGTNAFTSQDVTCYVENIPSNQVENWAKIQADRFQNAVIRGFHTELETVYEEKNMSLTQDSRKVWEALDAALFPNHPYGKQTVLGTQEHLKNPSITNIKNYHKTYYVPNNMAICVAGDFDPDKMIAIIDKYFGQMAPNPELPKLDFAPEKPITEPIVREVFGLEAENLVIGWRLPGATDPSHDVAQVAGQILYNGQAGLIDLNLNQQQQALGAYGGCSTQPDYSTFMVAGRPKQGQSLEQLRDLLLAQVDLLRKGEFDESLIAAAINNNKLDQMNQLESNNARAMAFVDSFINGSEWADEVAQLDRMAKVTKEDVVAWANEYLASDAYAIVYKRRGEDKHVQKIAAPKITPIATNRDMTSDFLAEIQASEVKPIEPVFVDFKKEMSIFEAREGVEVLYKENEMNEIFSMNYTYDMSVEQDPALNLAFDYVSYLGTPTRSAEQIASEMYQIACWFGLSAGSSTTVSLSGLSEHMPKAMEIVEDLLSNATPDEAILAALKQDIIKKRLNAKLSQSSNFSALRRYIGYGADFVERTTLSNEEVMALTSEELLSKVRAFAGKQHQVVYYGPMSQKELAKVLDTHHKTAPELAPLEKSYPIYQKTAKSEVLLAQYDAKQLYYCQFSNRGEQFDLEDIPAITLYNEYFGGSMNAIVFQEMREARGLAYSASAHLFMPSHKDDYYHYLAFIATQNDKMQQAIEAFDEIINQMPESEAAFNIAKEALLAQLRTDRTIGQSVLLTYLRLQKLGLEEEYYQQIFDAVQTMTLADVKATQEKWIKNRTYTYGILGDIQDLDLNYLKTLGPIRTVSQEEIFGY